MAIKSSSVCALEPEKIAKTKWSLTYGTPCRIEHRFNCTCWAVSGVRGLLVRRWEGDAVTLLQVCHQTRRWPGPCSSGWGRSSAAAPYMIVRPFALSCLLHDLLYTLQLDTYICFVYSPSSPVPYPNYLFWKLALFRFSSSFSSDHGALVRHSAN